jgi:hypothetical protein
VHARLGRCVVDALLLCVRGNRGWGVGVGFAIFVGTSCAEPLQTRRTTDPISFQTSAHLPQRVLRADGGRHLLLRGPVPLARHLPQPLDVAARPQQEGGRWAPGQQGSQGVRKPMQHPRSGAPTSRSTARDGGSGEGRQAGAQQRQAAHPELSRDTNCTRSLAGMLRMAPLRAAGARPGWADAANARCRQRAKHKDGGLNGGSPPSKSPVCPHKTQTETQRCTQRRTTESGPC